MLGVCTQGYDTWCGSYSAALFGAGSGDVAYGLDYWGLNLAVVYRLQHAVQRRDGAVLHQQLGVLRLLRQLLHHLHSHATVSVWVQQSQHSNTTASVWLQQSQHSYTTVSVLLQQSLSTAAPQSVPGYSSYQNNFTTVSDWLQQSLRTTSRRSVSCYSSHRTVIRQSVPGYSSHLAQPHHG